MSVVFPHHSAWKLAVLAACLTAAITGCSGPNAGLNGAVPATAARHSPHMRGSTLPSQLLFVPTGNEAIDIYDLQNVNGGPLAQITADLVGTQYQMTTDSANDLFVVNDDFLTFNHQYVTVYAPPYSGAPTHLTGVTFPIGVAVDASGTVYVTNCGNYCSQSPAINVYQNGSTTPTSTITSASFGSLGGLAIDRSGNLYVASSDRTTGASDIFEVAAGSSTPQPLHLKGLFNIGGPGIGTVAVDTHKNLYVGSNSNSTYYLVYKHGKTTAQRIIDPFAFFDVPAMTAIGPDGNFYASIDCGSQTSCEGAALGFKPKGVTPFEAIGRPGELAGVATAPNPLLKNARARPPDVYLRCSNLHGAAALIAQGACAPPVARGAVRGGVNPFSRLAYQANAAAPMLRKPGHPVPARHSGGWISRAAKGTHLIYISESGNGSSDVGAVFIYPAKGQTQAPIGEITNGISIPQGMATDKSGNLYVANSGSSTVTVYPPGETAPSVTYTNGISVPYDVAAGKDGTVYVANVFATPSYTGNVTEYPSGSTTPNLTITNPGQNAVAVALDKNNNLYVAWYSFNTGGVEVDKYAPGSTNGTNLGLDLPAPSFPVYSMDFDHHGNLALWYEDLYHASKYLATFPPGSTEPSHTVAGGSFLSNVSGIRFPHKANAIYVASVNVNEGDELTYPDGLPLDIIGLNHATGIALSPGT
jgi:hypothetical protein